MKNPDPTSASFPDDCNVSNKSRAVTPSAEFNNKNEEGETTLQKRQVFFRNVMPTDLPAVHELEYESYPSDEAASKEKLQYRQHHAALYFRCAIIMQDGCDQHPTVVASKISKSSNMIGEGPNKGDNCSWECVKNKNNSSPPPRILEKYELSNQSLTGSDARIIGYITSTRCHQLSEESMSSHDPSGKFLAIHSVVVHKGFRNMGLGTLMLRDYMDTIEKMQKAEREKQMLKHKQSKLKNKLITKFVLLAKKERLTFYINAGFHVIRKSPVVHGKESWYECVKDLESGRIIVDSGNIASNESDASSNMLTCTDNSASANKDDFIATSPNGFTTSNLTNVNAGCSSWVVDSFVVPKNGIGVSGTGNPAGVVFIQPSRFRSSKKRIQVDNTSSDGSSEGKNNTTNNHNEKLHIFDPDIEDEKNWMKTVAAEFNLSETAFVWEISNRDHIDENSYNSHISDGTKKKCENEKIYGIRFYTCSGAEVDLCGHATMGASCALFSAGYGNITTESKVGDDYETKNKNVKCIKFLAKNNVELLCRTDKLDDASSVKIKFQARIEMNFPWKDLINLKDNGADGNDWNYVVQATRDAFFPSIGLETVDQNYIVNIGIDESGDDLLIEVTPDAFASIPENVHDINLSSFREWSGYNRGIILCSLSNTSSIHFKSRFFGPKVGIEEDPVTGSAHCVLGPYFGKKIGESKIIGYQDSKRGGIVKCALRDRINRNISLEGMIDDENVKPATRIRNVTIEGTAVVAISGRLHV